MTERVAWFERGQSSRPTRRRAVRASNLPQQGEIAGMVTSDAAGVLHAAKQESAAKESVKKRAENAFAQQCEQYRLPTFVRQFALLKSLQTPRKDLKPIPKVWRYDFMFPAYKLIVEVDGGIWMPKGGAHSHPIDIERNILKRNDAVLAGYDVISFTTNHVLRTQRHAIAFTQRVLAAKGWKR